jgi:hypothetical protein
MFTDPLVEGPGDRFLPAGQCRDLQDVAQEVSQRSPGLAVGFAQSILGNEQVWSVQYCGEGGMVVRRQLLSLLQSPQRRVVAGEVLDERLDLRPVGFGKSTLAGWTEQNPVSPLNRVGQRKPDQGSGLSAVAEAHQRREGLLQRHDPCE